MFEFVVVLAALGILAAAVWFAFKLVISRLQKHSYDEPESVRTQLIIPPDLQNPQDQTQHHPRRTRAKNWLAGRKDRVAGHFSRQRSRYGKIGAVAGLFAVVILATAMLVAMVTGGPETATEVTETEESELSEEDSAEADKAETCPSGHVVDFPSREGNRLNAEGVQAADTEGFRQEILDQASSDPLTLFHYYQASPLAEHNPLEKPEELVNGNMEEGNCYSEEGIRAFNEWKTLWITADLTPTEQVSHTGVNTGVDGDQPTHSHGVGGSDQSGHDVVYVDANGNASGEHSVLDRCTQPTLGEAPPSVPEGPTDSPEQPEPEKEKEKEVKDPSKGPLRNDDIPEQVKGPGTTPPGGDPGDPDDPADHDRSDPDIADDGCEGDCPQAQPESPEADSERTPSSDDEPPESDEPADGNDPDGNDSGSCEDGSESCGYEQPNSSDGSPEEGDSSSGGGEDGVVESPDADDSSSSSDDSQSSDDSSSDDNPDHNPDDPEDEPSEGSSEDTSDVDEDTEADQDEDEDESNDSSGENPF